MDFRGTHLAQRENMQLAGMNAVVIVVVVVGMLGIIFDNGW